MRAGVPGDSGTVETRSLGVTPVRVARVVIGVEKKSPESTAPSPPAKSNRGGRRPGAGRPKGARNKVTAKLKQDLAPFDEIGLARLKKIIETGRDKDALDAIRLAWAYRHGRPTQVVEEHVTHATQVEQTLVRLGGDKATYIETLRRMRAVREETEESGE